MRISFVTFAAVLLPNGYFCRLFSATNLPSMLLVLVGIGGIIVAIFTLNKIERQAKASENAITLQFRPRLAIRGITIHDWNVAPHVGGEATPRIEFAIVNAGASVAHIVEIVIQTYSGDSLPVPNLEHDASIGDFALAPGETAIRHVLTAGMVATAIQWLVGNQRLLPKDDIRSRVFVAGIVRYRDDVGISRSTGFFREYKPSLKRFVALSDPDYEYED